MSPDLRYANLAVRGKLLGQVSIAAGGNDLLRPRADPDTLAASFDRAVASLRSAGSTVMLFSGFDPAGFPLIRLIRGKVAAYNAQLRLVARRYDCLHVDLWSMRMLADPREWCTDRLHLAPDGHRRVALRACEVAGVPVTENWRAPLPPVPASDWLTARQHDLTWARTYAAPWLGRCLRGVSSGDGRVAKRPDLQRLG